MRLIASGTNQNIQTRPTGSGNTALNYGGGTGGVGFYDGSTNMVASVTSAGKGTFNGGVAVESTGNITVTAGTGAPAAGNCTASTIGALYLNKSGGATTTLYVCTAAGTWTAK